ncbi:MAG: response regulator [Lachnospiraceae bacterium]|nr:response regulator [Lachnospiraceae bacterium]
MSINEDNNYFDLTLIMRIEEINLRMFAADHTVSVGQYFEMLSELLTVSDEALQTLNKFEESGSDKNDYRIIEMLIKAMTNLDFDKYILDFHSMLNAHSKSGNWREAAFYAKQLKKEFTKFSISLKETKLTAKPKNLINSEIMLSEYIALLDEEEAERKPLILAIDDSPVILRTVSSVLSDDYKVFTLPKPLELKRVLKKLSPELFLIDYQMPDINGFDLVPIIREYEEHKDTPIIFLTSEGTTDHVTAAIALGADDFIVKPFNPDVLRERIAKYIVKKKLF